MALQTKHTLQRLIEGKGLAPHLAEVFSLLSSRMEEVAIEAGGYKKRNKEKGEPKHHNIVDLL